MWRSEDFEQDSAHTFYRVSPRNQTQVVGLGSKPLYPQSPLSEAVFTTDVLRINRKHQWLGIRISWEMCQEHTSSRKEPL